MRFLKKLEPIVKIVDIAIPPVFFIKSRPCCDGVKENAQLNFQQAMFLRIRWIGRQVCFAAG
ncbi:MAG: hypothetical protein V4488_15500 [Pseudomonadota bacterium]